ncbi:thioredoxin domain containing 5 [Coprinopsis cinerea okayama7|uniref:Thioredoxin domain containing 5 n=1 Tax=Coprinopsis cinerea (strain Okayama-7 / 130 / ATCC MYA-4618 / FGSC 9003) TaxID=240176 RepID=A8P7I7_COPC7|nr:thioredoxin domain containing 5 [Coprinopsis cinerea okayama7\|eukprot:XP_001839369.2 thioredoxin domain containing 5 [Coprinopsis cinerea okayama7\
MMVSSNLFSALVASFFVSSLGLPVDAKELLQLTPDTFDSEVSKGYWFIEHYSPYCGHCTAFEPTWRKLVDEAEEEIPAVKLAQVNCAVHGDLCNKNKITGYPTLLLFEDGKIIEKFKGGRKLDALKGFLKEHVKVGDDVDDDDSDDDDSDSDDDDDDDDDDKHKPHRAHTAGTLNPSGQIEELTSKTFQTALNRGPTFVKFYAPWCGHCKKLAPIWMQLASSQKGRTQIAEVNCDNEGALCKSQDIKGYPTLVYFQNGARSEYVGGRKLDQLQAFADKASAETVQLLKNPADVEKHIKQDKVAYVLIYTSNDRDILKIMREDSSVLLGSVPIYATPSAVVREKYGVPVSVPWALVALKDHDSDTPSATLYGTPTSTREDLKAWLTANRLPTSLELTQDTFQSVMNAPHAPLVVIATSNKILEDKIQNKMEELGRKWRKRNRGSGVVGGKDVVWTWMDGERWKDWMKSMYSIKIDSDEDDLDDVKVVVARHKDLVYYDQDRSGKRFKLTHGDRLFKALDDIVSGKLGYKNSENVIERFARTINNKMISLEVYISTYPFRFIFFLLTGLGVLFWVLFKWVGSDAARLERGDHVLYKAKEGRID